MFLQLNISDKKFNHFNSIQKKFINQIFKKFPNQVYLAGGAVRSVFDNSEIKDLDFFMNTIETYRDVIQYVYHGGLQEDIGIHADYDANDAQIDRSSYSKKYAVSTFILHNNSMKLGPFAKIQIIFSNENDITETLNTFDLTAAMFAYDGKKIITTKQAIKDARNKVLRIHTVSRNGKVEHILRYRTKKGYTFSNYFCKQYFESLFFHKLKEDNLENIAG